jgi:hypothetical protein
MSDEPFFPERPRLMSQAKARDIARGHKAMARLYESAGDRTAARREQEESVWWLAYSIALANTTETDE